MDVGSGVLCRCRPGFAGPRCAVNVDDCARSPCQNSGTCVDGVNDYTCSCTLGFTGKNCSVRADACLSHACLHGGTCYTHFSGPVCQCVPGFMGPSCEFPVLDRAGLERAASRTSRGSSPSTVAALCVLGVLAACLGVCVAVVFLRRRRQRLRRQQLCDSVFNDLETVNNLDRQHYPYEHEFLSRAVSQVKPSNTEARLSCSLAPGHTLPAGRDFLWSAGGVGIR